MLTSNATRNAAMETLNLVPRRTLGSNMENQVNSYESVSGGFDSNTIARSVMGNTAVNDQRVVSLPPINSATSTRLLNMSKNTTQEKLMFSTKAKIVVSAYVAVVLLLVMSIALTIGAMNVLGTEIAALNADLGAKIAVVTALEEAVAALEDDIRIGDIASGELGLNKPNDSNTMYYSTPKTRAAQNYNVNRNWFDKLCDWLGGIVGG